MKILRKQILKKISNHNKVKILKDEINKAQSHISWHTEELEREYLKLELAKHNLKQLQQS